MRYINFYKAAGFLRFVVSSLSDSICFVFFIWQRQKLGISMWENTQGGGKRSQWDETVLDFFKKKSELDKISLLKEAKDSLTDFTLARVGSAAHSDTHLAATGGEKSALHVQHILCNMERHKKDTHTHTHRGQKKKKKKLGSLSAVWRR